MHDHPAVAELRKTQQQLRDTETQLATARLDLRRERAHSERLVGKLDVAIDRIDALVRALGRVESTRHLSGRPLVPEQTAGDCDATWMPRHITDVHLPEPREETL